MVQFANIWPFLQAPKRSAFRNQICKRWLTNIYIDFFFSFCIPIHTYLSLYKRPTAFRLHPGLFFIGEKSLVHVIRCCTSLHVKFGLNDSEIDYYYYFFILNVISNRSYFVSRAKASIPAANGAAADVPV